jgi:hypothetical protein
MLPDRKEDYECRTVRMLLLDSVIPEEWYSVKQVSGILGRGVDAFGTGFMTAICRAS